MRLIVKDDIPAEGPAYRLTRLLKRSIRTKTTMAVKTAAPMTIPAIFPPFRPLLDGSGRAGGETRIEPKESDHPILYIYCTILHDKLKTCGYKFLAYT